MALLSTSLNSEVLGMNVVKDCDRLHALKESLAHRYTKQSRNYDARRSMSVNARFFFEVAYRTINEMIGPTHKHTVHVDVPVGTARFFCYLRDRGRTHRMFGFDLSPGMLSVGRAKAEQHSAEIALARGDAFHLPLADDTVDVLTSMRFFHLLPSRYWPAVLAEMHRVIRPGGFLITEMRNPLRGGAVAFVADCRDRWFRGGPPHTYVWPHRLRSQFADWSRVETRGAGLDGLAWLSTLLPRTARRLHDLARYTPGRYLTRDLVIKAYKSER